MWVILVIMIDNSVGVRIQLFIIYSKVVCLKLILKKLFFNKF